MKPWADASAAENAEPGAEAVDGAAIPQQQCAAHAADSEAGEDARQ
ncbi:hypothetical protein [Streptomyces zagrosensis]|uniref:Uncharacterized protein n=1 Tax=Streptomyces zagrosensis TaxID=1042984 RepID=A0A7W9QC41_9ACTN|nr:hypothetical protein [Streptomyces zagrosensis]MBB5937525.1 hypothetical protein [Streptomyces zagrosensis]